MTIITKHRRGFFGWIFLILFWAYQGLMGLFVYATITAYQETAAQNADAAWQVGAAIGGSGLAVVGWFAWMLGTVVLGLPVLMTRGRSVTVVR